jgi:hypothetical protein
VALELDPPQPEAVAAALERLLADEGVAAVDPWWAAGLAETLGSGDSAAAQDARSGAGVVES